jgi:hypothetical protein
LHPDQLLRPDPAMRLQSLHPNHVWQTMLRAVLYYLKASPGSKDAGRTRWTGGIFARTNRPT